MNVAVVDYGAGNTRSVRAALSHLGLESVVTSDASVIRDAEFVVLPGVGSARSAMVHLNDTGAASAIRERYADGGATLGICLGMQLALTHSEEDGGVEGLGLMSGEVVRLREGRVPRLGWSVVEPWGEAYYFAHSYAATSEFGIASVDGVTVAVQRGSFLGVQFHPEKSGPAGLAFLEQCLSRA
ncbi:MAG TPA: imidazole glycerol phosphate synthase subunit HisH [Acidimicrobiales bacterium]|nr:imidazole glycerol phosphate synthase subunit HisH [Acidimicrobiales bacterium]